VPLLVRRRRSSAPASSTAPPSTRATSSSRDGRHGRRRRRRARRRRAKDGKDEYTLTKFMRSNQGTLIHHKPIVELGDKVKAGAGAGRRLLDRHGELALGANLLVAFMPFEGFNFEDAIVISSGS
jgi:DNA-directed RNA polymerase beta subunit